MNNQTKTEAVEFIDISSKSWIQMCSLIKFQESKGGYDPHVVIMELLPTVVKMIDNGDIQFTDVEVRDVTLGLMTATANLLFNGELAKYIQIDYPRIN